MSSTLSLFQHPGNKGKLKHHLLPLLQAQLDKTSIHTYCEPFLGSASLCFALLDATPPITKLVMNDRDMGIASLWTAVLRSPEALIQRVQDFAPSVEAFHRLKEFLQVRKVTGGHEGIVRIGKIVRPGPVGQRELEEAMSP